MPEPAMACLSLSLPISCLCRKLAVPLRLESSTKKMKIDKILIYIALLWAVLALPGTLNAQKAMGDDASGHSHTGHPKNKVVAPS